MPQFASFTAYVVIDTFALLLWHRIFFVHILRSSYCPPHLKHLIDYYLRQCQPMPIEIFDEKVLRHPMMLIVNMFVLDTSDPTR